MAPPELNQYNALLNKREAPILFLTGILFLSKYLYLIIWLSKFL